MGNRLEGKVAVITGASKGIGAEIARRFASEGARVVVNHSNSAEKAEAVVNDINAQGGKAIAVKADVRNREQVQELFRKTTDVFGPPDILVNNAGIYSFVPLKDVTEQHYRDLFDTNMLGILNTTQEAVKYFGDRGGNVINISSVVAHTPAAGGVVYSATKAAVETLSRGLALELGGKIRVNVIAPGMVETEGLQAMNPDQTTKDYIISRSAIKRLGLPEDIAKAAVYLASDDSSWVSGETHMVAGGARL
jgi:3-oxoacyl-[acyl-carrier protein] reductase